MSEAEVLISFEMLGLVAWPGMEFPVLGVKVAVRWRGASWERLGGELWDSIVANLYVRGVLGIVG